MAVGRYAPSPSGDLHVGNLRTAMLAWLFARASGSELRLRIDDLDPSTQDSPFEDRQLADLDAVGVTFDGPVVRQSARADVYEDALTRLDAAEMTYPCFCSRREIRDAPIAPHDHLPEGAYPGTCRELDARERAARAETRPAAIRVRAEGAGIDFFDTVFGPTHGIVDDFVVRRNDGVPSYNLATVLDDAFQGIEQVVRGADLLAGTARQIWLRGQLGLGPIEHAHVPLVVNADGERLAKRDGAVTLAELAAVGVSSREVAVALVASLGLDVDDDASMTELAAAFDPARLSREPLVWSVAPVEKAPAPNAPAQKKGGDRGAA